MGEHPIKKNRVWDFPGGPVVKTLHFHAGGAGSIPGRGAKIPQVVRRSQEILKKR